MEFKVAFWGVLGSQIKGSLEQNFQLKLQKRQNLKKNKQMVERKEVTNKQGNYSQVTIPYSYKDAGIFFGL